MARHVEKRLAWMTMDILQGQDNDTVKTYKGVAKSISLFSSLPNKTIIK
jgi:uncharacterized protein YwbE